MTTHVSDIPQRIALEKATEAKVHLWGRVPCDATIRCARCGLSVAEVEAAGGGVYGECGGMR